jgi:hypothetical protein
VYTGFWEVKRQLNNAKSIFDRDLVFEPEVFTEARTEKRCIRAGADSSVKQRII